MDVSSIADWLSLFFQGVEAVDHELTLLIKEARGGSEEAFSALVSRYKGQVFRHAYAMMNDRGEAEDVAQEAFVKAFYSLSKLDNDFAFVSWLTRIVSNLCYDRLKKNKKNKYVQMENLEQNSLRHSSSPIDSSNTKLIIQEAMKKLSFEHRSALVLRDVQGYSYEEISGILKIPIGTVKSRINTARGILKKELSRGDENE
ncbi:RNA polymerase subunit sigma-24 [Heyndrickxia shackletonii]|uniref:RNA polymerase sigma factor n=1 Tax=Heyndrickxia shackletonii TaxID=157838 RepID=A0A0Q3WWB2_9BACI|nr:sigma-70 family RNA polymerase sigma factor [Heyndrickxia shackletonii]KQL53055.1 RNA polymerase subunit sigma-24 [Heyndrickxia shackletonii]NEY98612.1 sigma-70 family RNA polymerase sigma factor [Heyndrickxia shackletonii]